MLDIRFVRENPEVVKQNIKNKFQMAKLPLVDEVIDLDKENREIKQEVENLRAQRNKMSKQIGALMGQKKFEEAEAEKKEVASFADRIEELSSEIDKGHNYRFIGKVSSFCPVKPGCGGGLLMREVINQRTGVRSYAAATGSKGYRWKEAEVIRELGKEDQIDRNYYNSLVDEAVKTIEEYGDFEWFVSDNSDDVSVVAINPTVLQNTNH